MTSTPHLFAPVALTAALALGTVGCTWNDAEPSTAPPRPVATTAPASRDLVDTAVAAGDFTTLASLLQRAGLVETLKGPGPFTVFAPTDAAFAKVDKATLDALAKDPGALKKVLTYHVVPGKLLAADVKPGPVATVAGPSVTISVSGGTVKVGDATVIKPDVTASNGVIHVIDSVLLPPA